MKICVLLTALLCSTYARAAIFTDDTFPTHNWLRFVYKSPQTGSGGSDMQLLTGGTGPAPGSPARSVTNDPTPGSWVYNASIYRNYYYPPGQGPALDLEFSFDARDLEGVSFVGVVIQQSGYVWFNGGMPTSTSWQTYTIRPDPYSWYFFQNGRQLIGPGPDLSSAAVGMRFGFFTTYTHTSTGSPTSTTIYDNFSVSLVPAPATLSVCVFPLVLCRRTRHQVTS